MIRKTILSLETGASLESALQIYLRYFPVRSVCFQKEFTNSKRVASKVYSTDRSKAVVLLLVLLCVALWLFSTRRLVLCLTLCYFILVFFSPFSIS